MFVVFVPVCTNTCIDTMYTSYFILKPIINNMRIFRMRYGYSWWLEWASTHTYTVTYTWIPRRNVSSAFRMPAFHTYWWIITCQIRSAAYGKLQEIFNVYRKKGVFFNSDICMYMMTWWVLNILFVLVGWGLGRIRTRQKCSTFRANILVRNRVSPIANRNHRRTLRMRFIYFRNFFAF